MTIYVTETAGAGETLVPGGAWSTGDSSGAIRNRLNTWLNTDAVNGDTLIIQNFYNMGGQITTAAQVTIKGSKVGDGFRWDTSNAFKGTVEFTGPNVTVAGITLDQSTDLFLPNGRFWIFNGDNSVYEYNKTNLDCDSPVYVRNADNFVYRRNEIFNTRGRAATASGDRLVNSKTNPAIYFNNSQFPQITFNYFHDMPHEVIKTGDGTSAQQILMPYYGNNFCYISGRDPIDTTGGWRGVDAGTPCIIENSIFVRAAVCFDFKFSDNNIANGATTVGNQITRFIEVRNCQMWDSKVINTTTAQNDGASLVTDPASDLYWKDAITSDIEIKNCTFVRTGRGIIKAGLNVKVNNTLRLGNTEDQRVQDAADMVNIEGFSPAVAAEIVGETVEGRTYPENMYYESAMTFGADPGPAPTAPTFDYGPVAYYGGTVEPTNPVVSLSISDTAGSEAGLTEFTLTVTASAAVTGAQTTDVTIAGGSAADFELIAPSGSGTPTFPYTITIADGQTTGVLALKVVDDGIDEGVETVTFTIGNFSAGISGGGVLSQTFSITDNDATGGGGGGSGELRTADGDILTTMGTLLA